MLKRKISQTIKDYLQKPHNKVLVIDGARQVGKSFIIRQVGQELYPNFIEINLLQDFLQEG
ncbi:MAG: AAA family ATPase, partial [Phascolarctobacterium sp.]